MYINGNETPPTTMSQKLPNQLFLNNTESFLGKDGSNPAKNNKSKQIKNAQKDNLLIQ